MMKNEGFGVNPLETLWKACRPDRPSATGGFISNLGEQRRKGEAHAGISACHGLTISEETIGGDQWNKTVPISGLPVDHYTFEGQKGRIKKTWGGRVCCMQEKTHRINSSELCQAFVVSGRQ